MRGLATLIMRGRSQAAMVATVLLLLALLLPFVSILSAAVVALVTLRRGPTDGLVVIGISAVASGILGYLTFGNPLAVLAYGLMLWLPIWAIAWLLRVSRSLDMSIQAALGFGLLVILAVYVQAEDPVELWTELLRPLWENLVQSAGSVDGSLGQTVELDEGFLKQLATWMTGAFAAGFYLQLVLGLFMARWWQAILYHPGGFGVEFRALRISPILGYLGAPLLLLMVFLGGEVPAWLRDLSFLFIPLFFLQGLAVVHALAGQTANKRIWLVTLYLLLLFAMPHAELLVATLGLVDVWVNFRTRLGRSDQSH
jgi:hypothetical protein